MAAVAGAIAAVVVVIPAVASAVVSIVDWIQDNIQHNTHVANASNEVLLVKINGPEATVAEHKIKPGDVVKFGTKKGPIGITVYKADKQDVYEVIRELPSDISALVKEVNGHLKIVRVKYGSLWQEDE